MECKVPEKYVELIQDIIDPILRLPNQGARFAGVESNIFNVDVGLHQLSALSRYLFLRIHDVCGRHCMASLCRQRSKRD